MPPSISATNLIVIAILAVILFFAVRSSIREAAAAAVPTKPIPKSWSM